MLLDIDAVQFWFLDALWQLPISTRFFYRRSVGLSEHFNLRVPNHSLQQRVNAVISLIKHRLLKAWLGNDLCELDGMSVQRLICNHYQDEQSPLWFDITPAGGAIWEIISKPDWQRYLEVSYADTPHNDELPSSRAKSTNTSETQLIMAISERRLGEAVVYLQHYSMRYFLKAVVIDSGIRRPWQVSHWKELPEAHWSRIAFEGRRENLAEPAPDDESRATFYRWQSVGFNRFYCQSVVTDAEWRCSVSLDPADAP